MKRISRCIVVGRMIALMGKFFGPRVHGIRAGVVSLVVAGGTPRRPGPTMSLEMNGIWTTLARGRFPRLWACC